MSQTSTPYVLTLVPENLDDPVVAEYARKLNACAELNEGSAKIIQESDSDAVMSRSVRIVGSSGDDDDVSKTSGETVTIKLSELKIERVSQYTMHVADLGHDTLRVALPYKTEFKMYKALVEEGGETVVKDVFLRSRFQTTFQSTKVVRDMLMKTDSFSTGFFAFMIGPQYDMEVMGDIQQHDDVTIPLLGSSTTPVGTIPLRMHNRAINEHGVPEGISDPHSFEASVYLFSDLIWGEDINRKYEEEMTKPRLYIPIPLEQDDEDDDDDMACEWIAKWALMGCAATYEEGKAAWVCEKGISALTDPEKDSHLAWGYRLPVNKQQSLSVSRIEDGARKDKGIAYSLLCEDVLLTAEENQRLEATGLIQGLSQDAIQHRSSFVDDWANAEEADGLQFCFEAKANLGAQGLSFSFDYRKRPSYIKRYYRLEPSELGLEEGKYTWHEAEFKGSTSDGVMYFDTSVAMSAHGVRIGRLWTQKYGKLDKEVWSTDYLRWDVMVVVSDMKPLEEPEEVAETETPCPPQTRMWTLSGEEVTPR